MFLSMQYGGEYQVITTQELNVYIDENILHSECWDRATEKQRVKALNNSRRTLSRLFSDRYKGEEIPVEHLAEQAVWMLRIDETIQKAETGVTSINVDGLGISISQKDNTVAPFILSVFNLSEGWNSRRKVMPYKTSLFDNNRKGWW